MSIADFFFGRKQNSTNNRRSAKLNRKSVRSRTLSMEPLETRDLLSVTTGLISTSDYAALREQYPDFNLPADQSELNVMTADCYLTDLKSAITQAGKSTKPDLILVKTTDDANTITYSSNSDEISINVNASQYGSVTIIGWGTKELTLDANSYCRVMSISGNTDTYLGNIGIKNGRVTGSYGGGIYSTSSGSLTLTNCTISNNSSYGYGGGICIYNGTTAGSTGELTLTNCTISNNTASTLASASSPYSYGGGICVYNAYTGSTGELTLTNCTITSNKVSSTYSGSSSTKAYSYGGGICIYNASTGSTGSLVMTNCTISQNHVSLTSNNANKYSYGGGICIYNPNSGATGALSIIGSNIYNNTLTGSVKICAGVYMDKAVPELTIIDSNITSTSDSENTQSNFQTSGDLLIKNSSLTYATVSISGGNTWSVLNSSIVGPDSSGSGIQITSGDLSSNLTVSNSLIRSCQYGIQTSAAINANIVNSTIANNSSYGLHVSNSSAVFNIYNSIIASSSVYNSQNATVNAYNTLSSYTNWSNKNSATNYTYSSSQNLFDENYKLAANSQALNKGNTAYLLEFTDLAGEDRIQGIALDLGAYEYAETPSIVFQKETPSVVVTTLDDVVDEYDNFISLREAIMLYAGMDDLGTVITFDSSVCDGQTIALSGSPLFLRKSVTLDASNLDNKLTIKANGLGRAIQLLDQEESLDVSLRNINIIDGNSVYGAAIFNRRSDLTLDSCNVQYNTGYGIYNDYGDVTISSSELSNNSANSNLGGGLYNVSGSVVIDNSKIDNNAYSGIYNNSGSLTISNTQINSTRLANSKSYGIYNGSGQFALTDSILNYNAQYGVYNNSNSGVNTIVNCDISNNTSSGFYINTGTVKIDHSAFLSNNNGIEMGTSSNVSISNSLIGNSSQYGITTKGTVDAYSCTIAGSAMKDVNSDAGVVMMYNTIAPSVATSNSGIVSGFYNLSSYDSWSSGTGNVTYNSESPLLVDAENSDFHLAENSQAIDKGNNVYAVDTAGNALTVDLADAPRIQGTKIDIGAYEFDVQNLLATPEISLATDNDSIIVTISEVENATGYQIEFALNEDFTDSSVVDAQAGENVLESLTQGQTYYVRALALGDDFYSDSDYSAVQSVLLDFVPPAAPAITVDVNGADCVTVTVSETDNAVGYCIQYSTNENFTRSTIVDVDAGEIVFRGLNPATTYYFRAYAYSDQGLNSDFSPVETVTLPAAPTLTLGAPTEFAVTADGTTVNAVWAEVENASSYTITYSVNGSSVRTTITDIPETTFSFIGAPGATYAVQVKANGTGDYSDSEYCESQSVFVKIPLSGLTLSTTSPEYNTEITASFEQSDVTADYQWYCGTEIIDGATDASFTVTEDQIGQTITCVATGTGNYAGTDSVTTGVVPALPLNTPDAPTLTVDGTTITATWSAVDNATSYTVEYQAEGDDGWSVITGISGTTTSINGIAGTSYTVMVKANGTDKYSDSTFGESSSIMLSIPLSDLKLSTQTPVVGTVINAMLTPSVATAEFQWYCGTEIIDGATGSSFKVTTDQIGQTITCVATAFGSYIGSVSATTEVIPAIVLDAPVISSIDNNNSIVIVAWSAIDDADGYTFEYKASDSASWTTISGLQDTTASFIGNIGSTYYARIKAIGSGDYSDSAYSAIASVTIEVPLVPLDSITLSTETPVVGTVITTTLDPEDADVEYQWYSGSALIDGATDSSFTVTEEQIGQTITCVVTGTGDYTGTVSATTAVIPALSLSAPDAPVLTVEDSIVTATWSAVEHASSYTVEYQAEGVDGWFVITGVNKTTASFAGITGATYNVKVKAVGTGYYSDSEFSESASAFISIPLSGLALSTTSPEVDTVITASFAQSDVTANYQWYCGTEIIDGATDSSFTVTTDQIGQTITCVATGTGDYTGTVSATTAVVPALTLDAPDAPALTVEGTAITATWSAVDNASSYTVEYQVNGAAGWTLLTGISGTSVSFAGSANTSYNVCVKAVGTGIYSDSEFSDPSSIAIAIPLEGLTLSTTAPEVGTVITATLDQTDATATYQWYSGDTIIDGATEASFTVTEYQIGQTITCIATGTGDYSGTARATTAVVPTIVLTTPNVPTFTIVDTVITASWAAVDNASSYAVEYQVNGADSWTTIDSVTETSTTIDGTTGTTYNVRVKAVGTGYYSDSEFSESASAYIPIPLSGITLSTTSPEVGTVITVTLGQADATASYQWYSGETVIDGATASSFTVTEDQIGKTITCVATGTDKYTGTVSAATDVVPVVVLSAPSAPTFTVSNTVITATWSAVSNASGYTFEYQPEGFDGWTTITGIRGTSTSFPGMIGTTYIVRVKAVGTGNYTDSEYSELSSVTLNNPLTGLTLSTTTPEVGTVITTTISPADASAAYQWYSGDTAIEGATASSFTVTEDQIGKTISCAATGTGDYSGTIRVTTAAVPALPLSAPTLNVSLKETGTVIVSVGAVENASGYTLDYSVNADFSNATSQNVLAGATTISGLDANTVYYFRVKAVGVGNYSSSNYSDTKSVSTTGLEITINARKVTVNWEDDSPAADSVRYRAVGAAKWTVKKLAAGITDFSFNATVGTNYEIEVLLDQQETNILHGSAIVLDQAKLKADKAFIKDDTFQVSVTNYAAKNLSANAKQAIVIVNGAKTAFDIENQEGSAALSNGGQVAFANGLFTFTEMTSNTSYKVQISFSDGVSESTVSTALTVKTLKSPYLAPVITSATAVSDTSITVAWETTVGKGTETPAQKYTVQYSLDGVKWTNATTAATGNAYTIQKLKGGNEYKVRVLATKDALFEASSPSGVLIAETLTLPKVTLNSTSVKDDSFSLNVTNYQTTNLTKATSINVTSDKFGAAAIELTNGAGSATFGETGVNVAFNNGILTFSNVPSNTQQKIQVNFSDGVCTTAWSAALTVKTALAPYDTPILKSATAVSPTSVKVEWNPTCGKNSTKEAQFYTVQYSIDGERWTNANLRVSGTSYTIIGLKANTKYLVAVIANKDTAFNASLPSESILVTTPAIN